MHRPRELAESVIVGGAATPLASLSLAPASAAVLHLVPLEELGEVDQETPTGGGLRFGWVLGKEITRYV